MPYFIDFARFNSAKTQRGCKVIVLSIGLYRRCMSRLSLFERVYDRADEQRRLQNPVTNDQVGH